MQSMCVCSHALSNHSNRHSISAFAFAIALPMLSFHGVMVDAVGVAVAVALAVVHVWLCWFMLLCGDVALHDGNASAVAVALALCCLFTLFRSTLWLCFRLVLSTCVDVSYVSCPHDVDVSYSVACTGCDVSCLSPSTSC